MHSEHNVITMCICQFFQVIFLGSLWNSFIHRGFPLDPCQIGPLRTFNYVSDFVGAAFVTARTVFYKETYSPLEMPLHDMTSKEMAIPMRPASKKKKKKIVCCLLPWRPNCYTGALSSTDNPSEKPTVFKVIFTWLEYVDVCVGTVWEQWAMIWWHFSVFTVWQCKKDSYQNITNNELWILQDSWCCLLNILYLMSAVIYYNSHASLVLHHEWVYSHPANLLYLLQNIKYNSSQ